VRTSVVRALALLLLSAPVVHAELAAIRPEFQVSTGPKYSYYSYSYPHNEAQFSIDIGASAAGTFVVAWEDLYLYVGQYSRPGIFARRFDSLGRPLGGEFRTSPFTSYIKGDSHVASDAAGNFVVVWDEGGYDYLGPGDTYGLRIMAHHFNASGGQVGGPFQVNTYTTGDQFTPKVAFDGAGNFMVVWAQYGEDYDTGLISGQKYNGAGAPIGSEFQVNTDTRCCPGYNGFENPGIFDDIDIAGDEAGNFMVVWRGPPDGPSNYSQIIGRIFPPAGSAAGAFVASTATTVFEAMPAVAADHQGNFIVSWAQDYWSSIFARRFNAAGTPLGSDFQVNTSGYNGYFDFTDGPSIAADATGHFVIAWEEYLSQDDAIMAREFTSAGTPVANQFRVDVPDYYYVQRAKIGTSASGEFVVVWGQYGSYDSSVWSAVGRKLGQKPTPCSATPLNGCRETTQAGAGVLTFKKSPNPARSRLTWRFARGPLAVPADFGDPFTTDSYAVCLYDGSGNAQPLYEADVPGGGACGAVPCWKVLSGSRVDYFDKSLFVNGVSLVRLSPAPQGKSRVLVKANGANLVLPDTPLTTPVTLQLQGSHGECWTADYATRIKRNDSGIFKANPDL
jgi:hypothetical protein